ncbi:adenine phosphoribosyltransferase [Pacificimonas flava]|uniref:Adenine phosphoribosyltransferase n=2 Tax=Pacificimonas TaxID=1960290 RepID=A0A219B3X1_9SPHN|nr:MULTISPECIES: adenine phosphoribosyltransferase [Pacificimonas]MBZ6377225.1 adenine phosphoribosyltransferase [Pacificimonas aurantium]OWV33055.1 adenine phosphoribosyltransferase [Pacificimonas flava]
MSLAHLKSLIRTIPDFPKAGIRFRDVSSLLVDAAGFAEAVERMASIAPQDIDLVAGIEARGFIFAGAIAGKIDAGVLMVRKGGKLPGPAMGRDYALEYGEDRLEIHDGQIPAGSRVLLVDDLIATGGTALTSCRLIEDAGAEVAGAVFLIDLPDLGGAQRLRDSGLDTHALLTFEGE